MTSNFEKNVPQFFLLKMKFATKWVGIEVLNPSTKLYRDIEVWKKLKKNFINLEVKKMLRAKGYY